MERARTDWIDSSEHCLTSAIANICKVLTKDPAASLKARLALHRLLATRDWPGSVA